MVTTSGDPVLQLLRQAVKRKIFPGAVLCASREGDVRYDHALGWSATEPANLPLVAQAVFDVASLTKPVATAAAIMALLDAGELELDEPISTWMPAFAKPNKDKITIRHLLCHSAGMPAHMKFYERLHRMRQKGEAPPLGPASVDWVIDEIARLDTLPPGECTVYSDLGYIILGRLIEKISGSSLDDFCCEHIFEPLGMEDTFFLPLFQPEKRDARLRGRQVAATERCPWRERILVGEVHDDNCHAMGGVAGHAGLFSTAADLHRFALTLLRCSQDRASFFSPAVVREFWRIQEIVSGSTWALGWDTPSPEGSSAGELFSRCSVGHLAFTGCSIWIDRDESIIVVLLTNRVHPTRDNDEIRRFRPRIHNTIYGLITKPSPLPPPARMGAAPEPLHIGDAISIGPLAAGHRGRLSPPPLSRQVSSMLDTSKAPQSSLPSIPDMQARPTTGPTRSPQPIPPPNSQNLQKTSTQEDSSQESEPHKEEPREGGEDGASEE
ncbi:MAG: serine hydrolase [Myxococcales bacterium]|nr:serine hydrolase [Myxococcales bacterium]